ncbi:MAG: oleate hydratase [Xanthomonadaceae bacterium]|nr:oleate hydratase [Xanthomonadaceae bacterium]
MSFPSHAYLIGGGIGTLAAAAFMIRDGGVPGDRITLIDAGRQWGGALDGAGDPERGYTLRGGRMLTTDHYECTWDLLRSIPSVEYPGQSVFDETDTFNTLHVSHARARLVNQCRAKVPGSSMGFSMRDRVELLALVETDEASLSDSRITDWMSPHFFKTDFWLMWATTFAFQPWHSAVELRSYLHRFMSEFPRIETLAGVKRTVYNQYDALVRPLVTWLRAEGAHFIADCTVDRIDHSVLDGVFAVTGLYCERAGTPWKIDIGADDLVIVQNGSTTDASSLGDHYTAPVQRGLAESISWRLWEQLAAVHEDFGRPRAFNRAPAQSSWESFTVTLRDRAFVDAMVAFSGNQPGTGGLVTFKDSNWLMSVVVPHQPPGLTTGTDKKGGSKPPFSTCQSSPKLLLAVHRAEHLGAGIRTGQHYPRTDRTTTFNSIVTARPIGYEGSHVPSVLEAVTPPVAADIGLSSGRILNVPLVTRPHILGLNAVCGHGDLDARTRTVVATEVHGKFRANAAELNTARDAARPAFNVGGRRRLENSVDQAGKPPVNRGGAVGAADHVVDALHKPESFPTREVPADSLRVKVARCHVAVGQSQVRDVDSELLRERIRIGGAQRFHLVEDRHNIRIDTHFPQRAHGRAGNRRDPSVLFGLGLYGHRVKDDIRRVVEIDLELANRVALQVVHKPYAQTRRRQCDLFFLCSRTIIAGDGGYSRVGGAGHDACNQSRASDEIFHDFPCP